MRAADDHRGGGDAERGGFVTTLLERAPETMAGLPAWFATLSPDQLKSCWTAAVVDASYRDYSRAQLAAALRAVRDHQRRPVPLAPPSKKRRAFVPFEQRALMLLEAAPNVGDVAAVGDVLPTWRAMGGPERKRLRDIVESHGRLVFVAPRQHGQSRGRGKLCVKRVAP